MEYISFQSISAIVIIFITFFIIYKDLAPTSITMLFSVLIFVVMGILTPKDVLSGFSNQAIASIILLIMITVGLRKNFNLEAVFDSFLGKVKSYRIFLFRMMAQVAMLSSIINNTPVVAMVTPFVFNWGKKHNISPSRLMIPLSFATILGGMITIIGTSTTLILNGFLVELNLETLVLTDFLFTGTAVSITGILFLTSIGYKLLPDHRDALETFEENKREYLIATTLTPNSDLIGQSVKNAGLRQLDGVYLVEILRDGKTIFPVVPNEVIHREDVLIFAGDTSKILKLVKTDPGIQLPDGATKIQSPGVEVVEAVLSGNSTLVGKRVGDSNFRNRYDAAIVAIHRNGERISGKIGNVTLRPGDLLLLYSGEDFEERVDLYRDLFITTKFLKFASNTKKKYVLFLLAILAVAMLLFGYFSLFISLLIIFSIMVAFRMITLTDVKRELDFNMVSILVFSLVLGQAIIKTDAGNLVATIIINALQPYGLVAIICGLLLLTAMLTAFITNVGAVSIAFPLAYSLSNDLNIDGNPFYLAIAFAASAAFMTPISYQTNLIVYGPGGYSFKDFMKIGLPMTVIYLLTALACVVYLYRDLLLS